MKRSGSISDKDQDKLTIKKLFDKVVTQIENNNSNTKSSVDLPNNSQSFYSDQDRAKIESQFSNVLVLLVDENISENINATVQEVSDDLIVRIKGDESVCKTRETYFMMDTLKCSENWIILKDRQESAKQIRINIKGLEFKEIGVFDQCLELAEVIQNCYTQYDGFVVIQSWDRMDYRSSCLGFMIEDLSKPIIFTGGRIPLEEPNSDLFRNLFESCLVAGAFEIPEVCIFCNSKLMRANRAILYQPDCVDAFISPNFKLLGIKDATLNIKWNLVEKKPSGGVTNSFKINKEFSGHINHCYYVPDLAKEQINSIFQDKTCTAILMEFFGAGNTPEEGSYLVQQMKAAIARGIPVFFTSQCHKGTVSAVYASSAVAYGAIACEDLTVPSAFAKIGFLTKKVFLLHFLSNIFNLFFSIKMLTSSKMNLRKI